MEDTEKDLAKDMQKDEIETVKYYENVNLELSKIRLQNIVIEEKQRRKVDENNQEKEIVEYGIYMKFKGEDIKIATINEDGTLIPNRELLENEDKKYTDEEVEALGDMINRLGLENEKVDMNKLKEQLKDIEAMTKEEWDKKREEDKEDENIKDQENPEEIDDEEQDEELEKTDDEGIENDDEEKERIAKKYNLDPKQVVHINAKGEKITANQDLEGLVKWAEGKEDIYYIPGEDPYTYKVIGRESKEDEFTEIEEASNQIHGKNPNITINRVDDEKITEVRPIAMYDIDGDTAMAIVKDDYGKPEVLYCRKQEGKQEYFGTVVPEVSGKNVRQQGAETRNFMTHEYNSGMDLNKKADELEVAQDLEERGVPSDQEGVQAEEIDGSREQNYQMRKEAIEEDLYRREGLAEKMKGAMPGYIDYMYKKIGEQADKILKLMQENDDMTYEQAVQITEQDKRREEENEIEDSKVPWENSRR